MESRNGGNTQSDYASRIINILLCLMCVCAVMGSSYFGLKLSFFTLSPFRIVFLAVLLVVVLRRFISVPTDVRSIIQFYGLWFGVSLLSILWSKDTESCIKATIILGISFCTIIAMCNLIHSKNTIKKLIMVFVLCYLVVIGFGVFESVTGKYFFVNKSNILSRMSILKYRAPLVFFTNQNDFSLFVVFGIFTVLYKRETVTSVVARVLLDISIAVGIGLIIFADSRGCMLSLLLGIFVWTILTVNKLDNKKKAIIIIIASFVILVVTALYYDKIIGAMLSFFHFGDTSRGRTSDTNREILIRNGIDMVMSSFGIGVGAGNSPFYLKNIYGDVKGIYALHNWFVQIFAEFGLLIGLLYIVQYGIIIIKLARIIRANSDDINNGLSKFFLTAAIMLTVGTISPSSVFDVEWIWMFWAIAIAYIGVENCDVQRRE